MCQSIRYGTFDIIIVSELLLITLEEKSWDLLIFFEKSWKSPGINEANVLEKYKNSPGKSWKVLDFQLIFSVGTLCNLD